MWERTKKILPVCILASVGLGVSIAIESIHRHLAADSTYTSFCNINTRVNCDVVLSSSYASFAGLSVAIWAILFYVLMLGLGIAAAVTDRTQRREFLARAMLFLAMWGLLFSVYMAAIALGVLHTVCVMCGSLYLVNIGLFGAAWWVRSQARLAGRRQVAARAARDRFVVVGSLVGALALIVIGGWEAVGHGVHESTAADIARKNPDFYRWYMAQPVVSVPGDDSHSRGSVNAPVTIVEFSDFECSHCAAFHQSLDDVLPSLGRKVRLIFRHFPLDSTCNPSVRSQLHPDACLAAVAAECAGAQGKFWQYHNILFAHQRALQREFLISYANQLGLDVGRFTACLGSAQAQGRVERDAREGEKLGIDSTPTIFINGRTIKGALDPQLLSDAVVLAEDNHRAAH